MLCFFRTRYDMLDPLIYGSLSVGGKRNTSVLGLWRWGRSSDSLGRSGCSWLERREKQLSASGQSCDSSGGEGLNKHAVGCCQETGLALCRLHTRHNSGGSHEDGHVTDGLDSGEKAASALQEVHLERDYRVESGRILNGKSARQAEVNEKRLQRGWEEGWGGGGEDAVVLCLSLEYVRLPCCSLMQIWSDVLIQLGTLQQNWRRGGCH